MVKKLTVHGNSAALIIDKPILRMLRITPKTRLQISTDGVNLIVSPVRNPRHEVNFQKALERVNLKHAKTFKKLSK